MAARPRKNRSESTSNSGKASISARPRSSDTVSPIWSSETAEPPTVTLGSASKAVSAALATSSSSASARIVPVTSALSPFCDRPARVASATPGTRASSPAAACARCSRLPAEPPTSRTMPADVCRPLARSSCSAARLDSDDCAVNPPPDSSWPTIGPPTTPARATKASRRMSVRRGRAAERLPRRSSMHCMLDGGEPSRIGPGEALHGRRPAPGGVRGRPADLRGPHRAHALLGCRAFATAHPSA